MGREASVPHAKKFHNIDANIAKSNEQIDSEEASESEDEDSSSGVGEDEMAETSTHQVEHNMKVNLPTEYLNLALREIKNTQLGRVASLKLDDSLLPESLRQPLQNSSLGPLPLEDIAKNLLLVTKDRLATRYGDLIDASKDLREGLLRSLTPAANAVLNMNSITVDE